jgi:hypothetical protein
VTGFDTMSGRSTLFTPPKPESCVTWPKNKDAMTAKASVIMRK